MHAFDVLEAEIGRLGSGRRGDVTVGVEHEADMHADPAAGHTVADLDPGEESHDDGAVVGDDRAVGQLLDGHRVHDLVTDPGAFRDEMGERLRAGRPDDGEALPGAVVERRRGPFGRDNRPSMRSAKPPSSFRTRRGEPLRLVFPPGPVGPDHLVRAVAVLDHDLDQQPGDAGRPSLPRSTPVVEDADHVRLSRVEQRLEVERLVVGVVGVEYDGPEPTRLPPMNSWNCSDGASTARADAMWKLRRFTTLRT